MSDLSRLLDDLYAMGDTEAETAPVAAAAPPAAPTEAPAWSSDEALDEVFETWVPGPDEDAPAAHRSFVEAVTDEPFVEAPAPVNWNLGLEDEPSRRTGRHGRRRRAASVEPVRRRHPPRPPEPELHHTPLPHAAPLIAAQALASSYL